MLLTRSSLTETRQALDGAESSNRLQQFYTEYWQRMERLEPDICAFVAETDARQRIEQETRRLLGKYANFEPKPALYGIPVGIKDLMHVQGLPTRAGSLLPSEGLAGPEGSLVKRLRELGAVIAGKTVTEEFAYAGPMPTRNPYHRDHTPGGSSAGSAAAVAAGLCPLAVGTQTLRSVTAPASFCGVVGYKPSYGRIPLDGVIRLSPSFDTAGLFTQDIPGMEYAAAQLIPDWTTLVQPNRRPVLGIPSGIYMEFMSDEVRLVFEQQIAGLKQQGYAIRQVDMPWEDAWLAGDTMLRLVEGEMARVHADWFERYRDDYRTPVKEAILRGRLISDSELEQYRQEQTCLRQGLQDTMNQMGVDLWVSPAQGGTAPKFGERTGWPGMTAVWTLAGCPTLSIPAASINGLPLGFQCIGGYGQDELLLAWSRQIAVLLQEMSV
ncbi:amidase [Paenibacillus donghaensis]|uniref:Amidase domain-containing protein n=1 Tax=Paenibacillus donghaensis TaxID=414771 RepID=A0A2Z2K6I8_9BACL|nr:amidase [Paenibacillus donghaensis]ASA20437.1 hypothetical protein B9T62_06230 [Paenibacillus donghaensis]